MADDSVQLNAEWVARAEFAQSRPPRKTDPSDTEAKTREATTGRTGEAVQLDLVKDGVKLVRDEESGRSYVQILDRKTGEVIYQIPPEELKKLAALVEQMNGFVVNTVA